MSSDEGGGSDSEESEPPLTNEEVVERTGASLAEVKEYREIFQLVDLDGGGSIDDEELGELMDLLGMNATKEEVNTMLNEIDSTGTGEVFFQGASAFEPYVLISGAAFLHRFLGRNTVVLCVSLVYVFSAIFLLFSPPARPHTR